MKYLKRNGVYTPYMALCFSEKDFLKEMKRLKVENPPSFLNDGNVDATMHTFTRNGAYPVCIVCMHFSKKQKNSWVMGLLVHEASHIYDELLLHLNESNPGKEIKAYLLQNIAQNLFEYYLKYKRKMKRKNK
jgi:hypothetical protein